MNLLSALKRSVVIVLLSSTHSMAVGECWYLEMPKKHAEYLVQECSKEDQTKYDKALASIPDFIKKRTIKEIEICERAEGDTSQQISGKKNPVVEHKLPGDSIHMSGAFYFSYQDMAGKRNGWGRFNLNPPLTDKIQPVYQINTSRMVSKKWCPTFVKYKGDKCYVLLERDQRSLIKKPIVKSYLTVSLSNPELDELKLVWLTPYSELPKGFRAEYHDMVTQRSEQIVFVDAGLECKIRVSQNVINLSIRHDVDKGPKHIAHKLDLKGLPKEKVELPYVITKDNLMVKEGEQGSLEFTLTPIAD